MWHKAPTCGPAHTRKGVQGCLHLEHDALVELLCLDGDGALLWGDGVAEQRGKMGFKIPFQLG